VDGSDVEVPCTFLSVAQKHAAFAAGGGHR
jgi:hypothetical protein